ncbi:hypothetical protein HDU91_001549, partial [Kappamyces sp. JEL0680]
MIDAVLIFNNDGKPRLMNWYQQLIFRPDDVQLVLSEIVAGGMVLEVHADVIQHGLQIAQTKRKTV